MTSLSVLWVLHDIITLSSAVGYYIELSEEELSDKCRFLHCALVTAGNIGGVAGVDMCRGRG